MRPLILFCSRTGNTAKVVEAMARAIGAEVADAGLATPGMLAGRGLVGLASGIYWARPDKSIFRAAELVPGDCNVFVAITSGMRGNFLRGTYLYLINRKLRRLKLNVLGRWHCPGHDQSRDPLFRRLELSKGRPDAVDLREAAAFAREMMLAADGDSSTIRQTNANGWAEPEPVGGES